MSGISFFCPTISTKRHKKSFIEVRLPAKNLFKVAWTSTLFLLFKRSDMIIRVLGHQFSLNHDCSKSDSYHTASCLKNYADCKNDVVTFICPTPKWKISIIQQASVLKICFYIQIFQITTKSKTTWFVSSKHSFWLPPLLSEIATCTFWSQFKTFLALAWIDTELVSHVTTCQTLAGTLQVTSAEQSYGDFVNQRVLKGLDSLLLKVVPSLFFFFARTTGRHRGLGKEGLDGNWYMWLLR